MFTLIATVLFIIVKFYTPYETILASTFIILITISFYVGTFDAFHSSAYFYIICYYFRLRTNLLNDRIFTITDNFPINTKKISNILNDIFSEHHIICKQIKLFNKFWKYFYFYMILTLIPINLICVLSVFLTKPEFFPFLTYIIGLFSTYIFIFFISFCASMVSKSIHLSHNLLNQIQSHIKHNNRLKVKLMSFIEKLLSNRLIYGLSVGPMFTMTFNKLCFVSLL